MDVACLGILVADIFVDPIDRLPSAGELRTTGRFLFAAGGCAANVAVNLRRLNRTVGVVGRVGKDSLGSFLISSLHDQGVNIDWIRQSERPTAATVILNVQGEDRRYVHCIGANADLSAADFTPDILRGPRVLYVGGYLAMPALGAEDLADILGQAKKQKMITVLDVVVVSQIKDATSIVSSVLPNTDYFLPNEDEARLLTGQNDVYSQARILGSYNPNAVVVVTRGKKGAVTWSRGKLIETPAFSMRSVDESGAGDAFAAGLIVGILEDWRLDRVLRFASLIGASCTRELGCSAGVFEFEEAVAYLSSNDPEFAMSGNSRTMDI